MVEVLELSPLGVLSASLKLFDGVSGLNTTVQYCKIKDWELLISAGS